MSGLVRDTGEMPGGLHVRAGARSRGAGRRDDAPADHLGVRGEVGHLPVGLLGPLVPAPHLAARIEEGIALEDGRLLRRHWAALEGERGLGALRKLLVVVVLLVAQVPLRQHVALRDVGASLVEAVHAQPRAADHVVLRADARVVRAIGDGTVRQDAQLRRDAILFGRACAAIWAENKSRRRETVHICLHRLLGSSEAQLLRVIEMAPMSWAGAFFASFQPMSCSRAPMTMASGAPASAAWRAHCRPCERCESFPYELPSSYHSYSCCKVFWR